MARKKAPQDGPFDIPQMERRININRKHKLTSKQQKILKTILSEEAGIVIIDGPAGTSKTYLAIYAALQEVASNGKPLLYLRSVVENSSRRVGHLPGTLYEKFSPFMLPLMDKLEEFLSIEDSKYLKDNLLVEALPINYLRGADWQNKIVVIDEAQNLTKEELVTILTRPNEGTKLIFCGDLMQTDIRDGGFREICYIFSGEDSKKMGIFQFSFTKDDIVRSKLVKFIVSKLQ
jgi:phosphate starvation-inducible PhoH-like protein